MGAIGQSPTDSITSGQTRNASIKLGWKQNI